MHQAYILGYLACDAARLEDHSFGTKTKETELPYKKPTERVDVHE